MDAEKSAEKFRKILQEDETKFNEFNRKYFYRINDPLTLVLKSHIFIEGCLTDIISHIHPDVNSLINDRTSFFRKVTIIHSYKLFDFNPVIKERIVALNNLRNAYAHNLEMKLDEHADFIKLTKGLNSAKNVDLLKRGLGNLMADLNGLMCVIKYIPFVVSCRSNLKNYERDDVFSQCREDIFKYFRLITKIMKEESEKRIEQYRGDLK